MVATDYQPGAYGGIGVHLGALTDSLRADGHRVDVLTSQPGTPGETDQGAVLRHTQIGPSQTAITRSSQLTNTFRMLQENFGMIAAVDHIKPGSYDIVHCHDFLAIYAARAASEAAGAPLVFTKHFLQSPETIVDATDAAALASMEYCIGLQEWAVSEADYMISVSDWVTDRLRERVLRMPPSVTIRSGVDEEYLNRPLRREYSQAGTPLRVAFVGRLTHGKGPDLLLEALEFTQDKGAYDLRFVGAGPRALPLQQAADRFQTKATFTGHLQGDDLIEEYESADVVVVPSRIDACPIVVREAQARGAVVLGSTASGIPEIVADGEDGVLFTSEDPTDLARCLMALERDRGRLSELGSAARERANRHWKWDAVAGKTAEAYEQALSA